MSLRTITPSRWLLNGLLLASVGTTLLAEDAPVDDEQLRKAKRYADVVMRLTDTDLNADAKTKAMVEKALKANEGLPAYVEIIEAFKLKDYDDQLVTIAAAHPDDATGASAVRVVLANNNLDAVSRGLASANGAALARALGNANDQKAVALLVPIVSDKTRDLPLRQDSVRALGKIEQGAKALLDLVVAGQAKDLKVLMGGVLSNAPWDAIREAAAKHFPPPQSKDNQVLPSNAELAKRSGNAANGEKVFFTICTVCHQVNGKGVDYGPALSEVGSKLGKDAIYEAILFPSNGIEHNYATTSVTLKDGNSALGIQVSETEDDLALKAIGGIVTKYKKADIAQKSTLKTSSMPAGLQAAMTQQELVDLVEFLSSLKKK
ncbi:MAG TPA: c-type cytochrome [Planctomycetota bacterium]|jgi:putative heme-binding domain-containing protein|nr:c-type cytochrome [Planctomycetota bacterium]